MSQTQSLPTEAACPQTGGGLHAALLRRLCAHMQAGSIHITMPGGRTLHHRGAETGPSAEVVLHRWRGLRRLILRGDIAFAQGFIDGDWSSPDVTALLELAAINAERLDDVMAGPKLARWTHRALHLLRANTKRGSRRNIEAHYDLGNEFYARWLDRGMTYSSALYTDPAMSLEAAQTAKQDRIIALLNPIAGASVLEIGMGWGGLAERLARAGCAVTGLTLSPAQLGYARSRLQGQPVTAALRDYRDEVGTYDHIVSIEMLEAVGESYWPSYFGKLHDCLRPGGTAVLQVITIAEDRYTNYRRAADFIQHYIFPGGMLPSPSVVADQAARAGLVITAQENFGLDYARTLAEWRRRFEIAWPDIAALGFPPRFRRLWHYYLCYCEAGFRAGALDVGLWRLEHAG